MYAPFAGRICEFNELLLDDPSGINADGYGNGWLFTFETDEQPLTPDEYVELLEASWDETQRVLKGQLN